MCGFVCVYEENGWMIQQILFYALVRVKLLTITDKEVIHGC